MTTMTAKLSVNAIDQQIQEAFPFSVDKYRLSGPDNLPTDHFGLFRSDNMKCIGNAVKSGYEPHTVEDICALAEAGAEAFGGTSEIKAHWNNGHFITVAPSSDHQRKVWDDRQDSGGKEDIYIPRLIIKASYDGKAFSSEFGIFRLVCRNLMSIPVKGKSVHRKIRHTASLRDQMPKLIKDFRTILSQGDSVYDAIDNSKRKQMDMANFIREVYPLKEDSSKSAITRHERRVESIMKRLHSERRVLGITAPESNGNSIPDFRRVTAWEAYNAIQGYVQHDSPRHKNPSKMDRVVLALGDKAVTRASELAFA